MALTFHIKAGDRSPPLEATLTDAGFAVDLSDIGELRFHMGRGTAAEVDAVATVVDGESGTVRYDWADGDTDTPGVYRAEFEVISAGLPTTFPDDSYITVVIHEQVPRGGS